MGRARLTLKCKPNESLRKLSFKQRSKVLEKKVSEFSTLDDVAEVCLIVYDANGDPQPLTWPQDLTKVHSITEKYEREKNVKPLEMFGLQEYFENKNNSVEDDISKVRKEILKIKYPTWDPSLNNLGNMQLRNLIAMVDTRIEACSQRINMLKEQHRVEAGLSQTKIAASNSSEVNFMPNISQSQLIPTPMKPLDDYVPSLPKHDMDSQSQMPHFDPNVMQMMEKNNGVMESANQVDAPLDGTKQSDSALDSTNQLGEPDWDSLLDDWVSELGVPEDWTSQLDEVMDCASVLDESVLHNVSCQTQNVQQGAALQTLTPTLDGFQTYDYNNMLQVNFFNHMNREK